MSASDAAPLPRAGEVFFDVRGNSRTMRVSWYGDTGIAVFSIWQGGTCTGTFRLPIPELPRMVEALSRGPSGGVGPLAPDAQAGMRPPHPGPHPGPRAGYPGAQEAGQPTAAMAPAAGYDEPAAGYGEMPPGGYRDIPPAAGYADAGYGSGYDDAPHGYDDAPHGYGAGYGYSDGQAGGYQDAPGAGYEDAAGAGYQDAPGAGYEDAPRAGYQEASAAGYQPAGAGYPDPVPHSAQPGQAGYAGQSRFAGQGPARTPSGPLPVGRWHEGEHTAAYSGSGPAGGHDGGYGGADPGYLLDQGYQPDPVAEGMAEDPLGGDYGGEAEQGYLPGPPTETFRPVAVGSHSRQAGQRQRDSYQPPGYRGPGYDPGQGHPVPDSDYSPYTQAEDSPPESLAYHPGHAGSRDREYRPSRGRP